MTPTLEATPQTDTDMLAAIEALGTIAANTADKCSAAGDLQSQEWWAQVAHNLDGALRDARTHLDALSLP